MKNESANRQYMDRRFAFDYVERARPSERVRDVAAEPAEQSALPSPRGRKVVWDVRPRNLDQHSGLREAPEGTSSRGSTAPLQRAALNGQTGGFRPN